MASVEQEEFFVVRCGKADYIFAGPKALRALAEALLRYSDDAEVGLRQWLSFADMYVAFISCLSTEDAKVQARALLSSTH